MTRKTLVYSIPLDGKFMAQLVLPADLSPSEAERLNRLILSLAAPVVVQPQPASPISATQCWKCGARNLDREQT